MVRLTKYSNDIIRNRAINIIRKLGDKNGLNGDELATISAFCLIERTENRALKEYEDLEEQGKLLKLPCAVGDTVYRICPKCNDSHNGNCKNCAWENSCSNRGCTVYGGWEEGQYPMGECIIAPYKVSWNYIPNLLENIGKRVFLTHEAAEAALKALES